MNHINDELIFRKKQSKYKDDGKAVGVSPEVFNAIKTIADNTGMSMTNVASALIQYGLAHMKYEEE